MRIACYTDRQIKEVEELKMMVRQLIRVEDRDQMRIKRRVFNFTGGIRKTLFRTMDNDDAFYYAEKISSLEREQLDFLRHSKGQVTVVKTTLRSLNSTLLAVSENDSILSKGLDEMAKHVIEHDSEIKEMFSATSVTCSQ